MDPGKTPRIVDINFPPVALVSGPCLEEILAMTMRSLESTRLGLADVVNEGRERWRLIQLASAVPRLP
jgi:hypothetical protein